jgi:hypothetical protein
MFKLFKIIKHQFAFLNRIYKKDYLLNTLFTMSLLSRIGVTGTCG